MSDTKDSAQIVDGDETSTDARVVDSTVSPVGSFEPLEDTVVPEYLLRNAEEYSDRVAMRLKHHGIWEEYTWEEYFDRVMAFCLGLEDLGFEEGEVLFTIGFNRPKHLWSWFGATMLGGIAAPNYEDMRPEDISDQLNLVEARFAYTDNQELVDKLLAVKDETDLEHIIYREAKGVSSTDNDELIQYEAIEERGRSRDVDLLATAETFVEQLSPNQTLILAPTSGTTGMPKRTELTHKNFVNLPEALKISDDIPEGMDYVSYLPMGWAGAHITLMSMAPERKWVVNFAEQPPTMMADLREVGPEYFIGSPTLLEQFVADIKADIDNTTWLKRTIYNLSMRVGKRFAEYKVGQRSGSPPRWLVFLHWLFYWVSYRPILDKMGLKRVKKMYTGGSPLGDDHFRFFHALGLNLKEAWGQTEACGFATIHRDDNVKLDTAGQPIANVQVGELSTGELLIRGPTVCSGYYNQPEKTAEMFDNGWLHTDDFGTIGEEGHVKMFDRMDDVMEMADGTSIAPVSIETKLKYNPYVKQAMVVGEDREYLAAILNIRFDNVAEWADQRDIQYTGYRDLATHHEVQELLVDVVRETNENLDVGIKRFVSLFKEFDPDDGEITQTMKLRRGMIRKRYETLIESFYHSRDEVELAIPITYRDGREDVIEDTAPIITLEENHV
jgi:long-chain acyl-CoA synthetase